MSRSNYTDDYMEDDLAGGRYRGMVASATRGKRGQQFFRDLLAALDAMPEKRLIVGELQQPDGEVCAIGALGRARGIDMSQIDPEDPEQVAPPFNIAKCLAQEVVYMNDEWFDFEYFGNVRIDYTPEKRWAEMREWVSKQLTLVAAESASSAATKENE